MQVSKVIQIFNSIVLWLSSQKCLCLLASLIVVMFFMFWSVRFLGKVFFLFRGLSAPIILENYWSPLNWHDFLYKTSKNFIVVLTYFLNIHIMIKNLYNLTLSKSYEVHYKSFVWLCFQCFLLNSDESFFIYIPFY